jgi:hypothetical protein
VVGDLFVNDKKAFKFMLEMDTVRGPHSTGIAHITDDFPKNVSIIKDVGTPWDMIGKHTKEFFNHDKDFGHIHGNSIALMGHNRWATVGKVSPDNAHPFLCGNIVGAQNGTIPREYREKLDDWEFYDTDTEALFANINEYGVENVIPNMSGAWALTWYDKKEDTFNVLRNDERPLVYAWKKGGKVLYYASEAWMIYAATEKYNIEIENDLCYHFDENRHYSWKLGKANGFKRDVETSRILKGFVEPPKPVRAVDYSKYYGGSYQHSAQSSASVFTGGASTKPLNFQDYTGFSKISYWVKKVGEEIEFTVANCIAVDDQKKRYVPGYTMNGFKSIRIYLSDRINEAHVLNDQNVYSYSAKIRKVKASRSGVGFYILLDLNSIEAATYRTKVDNTSIVDDVIPWTDDLFNSSDTQFIANGKIVPPDDYDRKVGLGCAWCTHIPSREDAPHLHWFNDADFLCADCASNPEVLQYIPELIKAS